VNAAPAATTVRYATINRPKQRNKHMKNLLARFVNETEGQDLIEYALLAGFISIVAITAITAVGTKLNTKMTSVSTAIAP
jgi:pilus assembly protein Flp/PilA